MKLPLNNISTKQLNEIIQNSTKILIDPLYTYANSINYLHIAIDKHNQNILDMMEQISNELERRNTN